MEHEVLPAVPEPTEAQAQAAWEAQGRILQRIQDMRRAWVDLARDLHEFDVRKHWRDLGFSSFGAWMADPDVEIERTTGYLLVQVWRELIVNAGADPDTLAGVEFTKASLVLPAVRRRDIGVDDALSDCRTLTRNDLKERYAYRTPNGAGVDTSSAVRTEDEPVWATCVVCGSRYAVKGT